MVDNIEFTEDSLPDEAINLEVSGLPPLAMTLFRSLIQQKIPRHVALGQVVTMYSQHMNNLPKPTEKK